MKIAIANRLCILSHRPGTFCLLPFSLWKVQMFPAKIVLEHLENKKTHTLYLDVEGPVDPFTLEQDLERKEIRVFGVTKKGYFRVIIKQEEGSPCLIFEKIPPSGLTVYLDHAKEKIELTKGQKVSFSERDFFLLCPAEERLSLGIHKKADWQEMKKRKNLAEIFPFWLQLAGKLPANKRALPHVGTLSLLQKCEELIEKKKRNDVLASFLTLFQAAFTDIFVPRIQDEEWQGILPCQEIDDTISPLPILVEGARLIRSMFFQEERGVFHILPCLPTEFHAGRFIHIQTEGGSTLHMEWSKKQIKKIIYHSSTDHTICLKLQPAIEKFRVKKHRKDRGAVFFSDDPIPCKKGEVFLLDRFQK